MHAKVKEDERALLHFQRETSRGWQRPEAHRRCAETHRQGACHCETQQCEKPLNAGVNFMVAFALIGGAHGCSGLQGDVIAPARRSGRARQKSSLYTTTVCTGSRPLPHALITGTNAAVINLDEASSQARHPHWPLGHQRHSKSEASSRDCSCFGP